MIKNWISIDPGLSGTGWVVWADGDPIYCGVLKPRKDQDWPDNAFMMSFQLLGIVRKHSALVHVIEYPRLMPGSSTGRISAASGSLVKLAFTVGAISNKLSQYSKRKLVEITWKGNMKKDVMQRRIERLLGADVCQKLDVKTHAWDALGIGLFHLGRF